MRYKSQILASYFLIDIIIIYTYKFIIVIIKLMMKNFNKQIKIFGG